LLLSWKKNNNRKNVNKLSNCSLYEFGLHYKRNNDAAINSDCMASNGLMKIYNELNSRSSKKVAVA
jgi:hypothetical protein